MRWMEAGRLNMVSALAMALSACSHFSAAPPAAGLESMTLKPATVETPSLADARSLFEANSSGLALTRVEAYLNANPDSAGGHNLAGAIFDRIGRYDLAERHYQKALALQADYVPAINNFGLSKLQRARLSGRADLEQEADALLARALALSAQPEQLALSQSAARAQLSSLQLVPKPIAAATPARMARTAWLERRNPNYTFVVTKPTLAVDDAMARELDPSLALVSPGA